MQVRTLAIALAVVCLLPSFASAQEAMRVSPSTLTPGDEAFLTIHVGGTLETDVLSVLFTGPGGQVAVEPNYRDEDEVIVWVPDPVLHTQGQYSVHLYVTRNNETFHFGPALFRIAFPTAPPNPPLVLIGPEVVAAEATDNSGTVITYNVFATDGTAVNCTPPSGSAFALGGTLVRCTANNGVSSADYEFPVFVQDTTPPALHLPADITSANPVVTFTVTATDTADPNPEVTCSPASGSTFATGTTKVMCMAVDSHANAAFGSFKVTVSGGEPVITVPSDISTEATSAAGAVVNFTVTATEGGVISCGAWKSGDTFPLGTTTVTCTATNASGSDTDSFNVRVVDTTAPVIVKVTPSPESFWPPNHKMEAVTVNVVAVDVADPTLTTLILSVSSNQPVDGTGDGDTSPDWEITGPTTVNLRAERSGNQDRVYTITVQVSDSSGNASTGTCEVRIAQTAARRRR